MNKYEEEVCVSTQKEKHIAMHEAIENLDSLASQLDSLIHRLEGPAPQNDIGKEVPKEREPTFMDVLNGGANAIREKTENAHKRIDRLLELLF